MIKLLQEIWKRFSNLFFPQDYYAWQTLIYLGIFSFTMSWVARLAVGRGLTVNVIATGGWIFFALGIGWLLEQSKIRVLGISVAPWVMGAILCLYIFSWVPESSWPLGLMTWPLISVVIAAIPHFFTWELRPEKIPPPPVRQQLILLTLVALLLSNWFQFYFRLQNWFEIYPSLLADDFSQSGFVYRMASVPEEKARGIVLLTSAETEIIQALDGTPWPYVERWLLGLDERLNTIEDKTIAFLTSPEESHLWRLGANREELDNGSYLLDLMAIWLGPASTANGYYLTKSCVVQPRSLTAATGIDTPGAQPTPMAKVNCDLEIPRHSGRPTQLRG
ncbi:MAG: DUF5357 family protein [Cyanobacteria bacterium P01_C01_bin.120]